MFRLRFSLRGLLLLLAFVGICLASWKAYYEWYEDEYAQDVLADRLHQYVRNGQSVGEVTVHLGTVGIDIESDTSRFSPSAQAQVRDYYRSCFSGVRDADEIFVFDFPGTGVFLQFRDGKLINHDWRSFKSSGSPLSIEKLLTAPVVREVSHLGWHMGPFHLLGGVIGLGALAVALLLARRRRYASTAIRAMFALPAAMSTAILCAAAKLEPAFLGWLLASFVGVVAWELARLLTPANDVCDPE